MSEDSEKEQGNAAFRRQDYPAALKHYDNAIRNAGSSADAALFSNKAAVFLKLAKYDGCVRQCLKGLDAPGLTPELMSKIYFRMGSAYAAQEKFDSAMDALGKCTPTPALKGKILDVLVQAAKHNPEGIHLMAEICGSMLKDAASQGGDASTLKSLVERIGKEMPDQFDAFEQHFKRFVNLGDADGPKKLCRSEMVAEHSQFFQSYKKDRVQSKLPFALNLHSGASGHVCTAPLCNLSLITISEMRFNEVNVGKVLVCRTIAEPIMLSALATLIEDPTGEVARFAAYNICSPSDDFNIVMPIGSYLAIKEPWYKKGSADGKPAVRVDNPADLVRLEQTHLLLKNLEWRTYVPTSWESYQRCGNELFVTGKFEPAIAAYIDAIELKRKVAPKDLADLLANRAAAYFGDGQPSKALSDCQSALQLKPDHLKATFRMAKALSNTGKYDEAKEVLAKSPHTTAPPFQKEITRLNRLIREQQSGEYDLKSMLREAAVSQSPRLDHADYNAGVRPEWISEEWGNGLISERDFAPGDMFFVSKVFEAAYTSEGQPRNCGCIADMVESELLFPSECSLRIIRRVTKDKDLAKTEPNIATVDSKRMSSIVLFNALGSSNFRTQLVYNALRPGSSFDGCGVWILASYLNHSCLPNTSLFFVGDMLFVRATKHIRKGEELTTAYMPPTCDYKIRQKQLASVGFQCKCELCLRDLIRLAEQPDLDDQREAFMDSNDATLDRLQEAAARGQAKPLAKLMANVRNMTEEFSDRLAYKDRFDYSLHYFYENLGNGYCGQRLWLKAAKAFEMAYFTVFGEGTSTDNAFIYHTMTADGFPNCFKIAENYLRGANVAKSSEYVGKMRQISKESWGSDDCELLELLFPDVEGLAFTVKDLLVSFT